MSGGRIPILIRSAFASDFLFFSLDFPEIKMTMKVQSHYIDKLLDEVCEELGVAKDNKGLGQACDSIEAVGRDYLYKNLLQKIKDKKPNEVVSVRGTQIDIVSRFLKYDNFKDFMRHCDHPLDDVALKLIGNYYSYLRASSEEGVILKSPVRIFEHDRGLKIQLIGKSYQYNGPVELKGECIFFTINTDVGKSFRHVYKVGKTLAPKILYGVFAGVSSTLDPIAGRVILRRSDGEVFEKMKIDKLEIPKILKSGSTFERKLAQYFKSRVENNLAVSSQPIFNELDLN